MSIAHNLRAASWPATAVTLTGEEYDAPMIGHKLDWEHATTVTLPPTRATIGARFTATGSMVISNSSQRERYDPWFYVTISLARARTATAVDARLSASDPDLTALRTLPAPDFAFVGHNIHTEITITHGRAPGGAGG